MSGILEGKRVLITGVLMESSIAFHTAKLAQEQGAEIILTAFPRPTLTERIAKKLPKPTKVIELDVTNDEHLGRLADIVGEELAASTASCTPSASRPQDALGGNFLNTPFESVATAMHVSAFSLKSLTMACLPLMQNGGSVVGLTFDAQFAWPQYDWMGPAKAALEATSRYIARDLGKQNIRCNLISAGPIGSMAAKSIPGFGELAAVWDTPLPAGVGPQGPGAGRPRCRRPAERLVPEDHRRDHPRGRRSARDRRVSARRSAPPAYRAARIRPRRAPPCSRIAGSGASPVRPSRPGGRDRCSRARWDVRTAPQRVRPRRSPCAPVPPLRPGDPSPSLW